MLIDYLNKNSRNAKRLIARAVTLIPADFDCPCHHALQNAIITDPKAIPAEVRRRLEPIVGKYLG